MMNKFEVKNMDLYYGSFHALKNINIAIPEKEVTAFIGPSGCGKSTFLKSLNRMNDLVEGCRISGDILLDGVDIYKDKMDVNVLRKRVGMAGFVLKNTLSDNGGVTRGICKMDENGNLTEVVETKNIVKTADGAEADGVVVDVNSLVSMNMWGLTPDFLDVLENGFKEFFEKEVPSNPQKAEYLIPIFIGELLEQGKMSVKVLKTNDTWYGMTYHEDVAAVKNSFKKMLADGVYKADLFSDL